MGKTKKPKPKVAKINPIGLPSVHDVCFNEEILGENNHTDGPISMLVEQLQSVSLEEKMCALQALTVLCQNQQQINDIINSEIVKIIASWLADSNKSIRNATALSLRSLSLCGVEICEKLVDHDVLTPLLTLLNEYALSTNWVPIFDKRFNEQMDERSDTFLQAINLVWTLCESSSIALANFNRSTVLQSFIRCLDYRVFGFDIAIAVGQCLLVISEDNPDAWRVLNEFQNDLISLLNITDNNSHSCILLRTLSAAILSNVPALAAQNIVKIFDTLSKTLDVNHRTVLGALTSELPLNERRNQHDIIVADDSNAMEEETESEACERRRKQDMPTAIDIEVKNVGWLLEAQRIAAETLTNLSSTDDEIIDEDNDDSDAESVHDYDVSSDNISLKNVLSADKLPIEVLEAVKSLGLVEKLWQRAQPIAQNVAGILEESQYDLLKKVKTLQISSLLCLQNLCNTMLTEDLGGTEAIYRVWLDLGQQVFQGTQNSNILEASTSLMRAALEHLKHSPELFQQMSNNDLQLMLNGVETCSEPEIRANWLRMLGVLGCLLPETLVKIIMEYILQTCAKEMDVWTISEALDALMDMFSDNDWNQIAFELNLVQKSKELERLLKHKLRQQKRDLGERFMAVSTVRSNLLRFTKYIELQQRKFTQLPT